VLGFDYTALFGVWGDVLLVVWCCVGVVLCWCGVVWCGVVVCCVVLCWVLCCVVLCSVVWCGVVWCGELCCVVWGVVVCCVCMHSMLHVPMYVSIYYLRIFRNMYI
jgi:hypothetical protein